ncbi:hypothetical protein O0I10_001188 [Lichtheimia ornata]|uniref:Uncharacterized protein n=1 Tax=Lichtheimia ornata TaxID=688661 RepID=A0AAD7Y3A7_9FUNG|nr:uncharacterized protein O0I10_001188 [Lichtheimia ornata]KAJ8663011.1 hypothetical protein O0I10_001188 [Lichtheimia ornata]
MSKKWPPTLIDPASRRYVYPNGWNKGGRKTVMQLIPQPEDLPVQKYTHNGKYLLKAFLALVFINTILSFFK